MKKIALLSAAVLLGMTAMSYAGEKNFNGIYAGSDLGYSIGKSDAKDPKNVKGDVFAGYNTTIDNFVVGVEGNASYTSLDYGTAKNDFGLGLDGKAGYLVTPSVQVYGVVGYAGARLKNSSGNWANGAKGGIGVEGYITDGVSARTELSYTKYDKEGMSETNIKTGVAYHF